MQDIAQRLIALKQDWQSIDNIPDDLTVLGLPGKNGQFVEQAIHELACLAADLASAPDENLVMIRSSCESYMKLLENFFFQDISGNPSMQILTFVTLLQEMHTALRQSPVYDDDERMISGRHRQY